MSAGGDEARGWRGGARMERRRADGEEVRGWRGRAREVGSASEAGRSRMRREEVSAT